MKRIVLAMAVLLGASAYAQPLPILVGAKCRFKGEDGKSEVRCRVEVSNSIPTRIPQCFPVELKVRCSNDFDLRDEFATAFLRNEGRDFLVVGIKHDKSVLLRVENRDPMRSDEADAELTLREDETAIALEGECRFDGLSNPVPAPAE